MANYRKPSSSISTRPAKHKPPGKATVKKPPAPDKANPMWGGQFMAGPAESMKRINASIGFDRKLYAQDIEGSIAHAAMLVKVGILSIAEGDSITHGLRTIKHEIAAGQFEFRESLEDIHMNIEARLAELIGDTAGKLHTARSRNDQVALDLRLYARDILHSVGDVLTGLQRVLLERAEEHAATIMPGFTHLQAAQPVTLGHHLMAYVEMFGRDRSRIENLLARMDECPLGAAALAGTSFPVDRHMTAKLLGFAAPMANSLDAVSDRDFVIEALSAASLSAVHLSRLSEEFVLWSSAAFGFVTLSDAFSSGSSIMPQKRNPDAAELIRGKAGRIFGAQAALMMTMKGLPLAYNKDMQEDKEPFFDAMLQWQLCLDAMTGMVDDFKADKTRMREAAGAGYSTATDLADWLVRALKLPFRQAHHVTAKIVKAASSKQCLLGELPLAAMRQIEPRITKDVYGVLDVEQSVASRKSFGGTSPERVREAIKAARKKYL